jgi:bifunctional ADP-heptose synthase (sugar kinase/adenylyltransferase)
MTPDEIKAIVAEAIAPYAEEMKSMKASLEAMKPPAAPTPEEKEAEMAALSAKVATQLRASLGLTEGVKLAVAPPASEPAKNEGSASDQIVAVIKAHVAEGKSRTEACRLAAAEKPDLYRAAVQSGGIRF